MGYLGSTIGVLPLAYLAISALSSCSHGDETTSPTPVDEKPAEVETESEGAASEDTTSEEPEKKADWGRFVWENVEGFINHLLGKHLGQEPSTELAVVSMLDVEKRAIDAKLPTDLLALPDNSLVVLDGYQKRLVFVKGDRTNIIELKTNPEWGMPVRMTSREQGGFWVTYPDQKNGPGLIIAVNEKGRIIDSLSLGTLDPSGDARGFTPLSLVELDGDLIVGCRSGGVLRINPSTGNILWHVTEDADQEPLNPITGLFLQGTDVIAVDPLGSVNKIHVIDSSGNLMSSFGRQGTHAGKLYYNKAVAVTSSGRFLVADTALDVVQLFDTDGTFLGVLSHGNSPITLDHPIALRQSPRDPEVFYVLDQKRPEVVSFRLTTNTEEAALSNKGRLLYRTQLMERTMDPAWNNEGNGCLQCHDGLVQSDLDIWDPNLFSHPVGEIPEIDIPPQFKLFEGRTSCTTCHSPHGDTQTTAGAFTRVDPTQVELCSQCHDEEQTHPTTLETGSTVYAHDLDDALVQAMRKSRTPGMSRLAATLQVGCYTCHYPKPHGAHYEGLIGETDAGEIACVTCHKGLATTERNHFMGFYCEEESELTDVTGVSTKDGEQITCPDCHTLFGADNEDLITTPETGALVFCTGCHTGQENVYVGDSGEAEGHSGVVCLECHDMHDRGAEGVAACRTCHGPGGDEYKAGQNPGEWGHSVGATQGSKSPTCGECHGAAHDPTTPTSCTDGCHDHDDELAAHQKSSHRDVDCEDCHEPHSTPSRYAAQSKYRLILREDGELRLPTIRLNAGCLACHSQEATFTLPGVETPRVQYSLHPISKHFIGGGESFSHPKLTLYENPDEQVELVEVGSSEAGNLICISCHYDMKEAPAEDPEDQTEVMLRPKVEQSCKTTQCHLNDRLEKIYNGETNEEGFHNLVRSPLGHYKSKEGSN